MATLTGEAGVGTTAVLGHLCPRPRYHSRLDASVIAALIGAGASLLVSVWTSIRQTRLQQQKVATDAELQAQRARLDQLDRLHSRRVEQIESLYAAIESATAVLLSPELPEPNESLRGRDEISAVRDRHAATRIYLADSVDRLCLDFLEELDRAWCAHHSAIEFGFAEKLPDQARHDIERFPEAVKTGLELRDNLRRALRAELHAHSG